MLAGCVLLILLGGLLLAKTASIQQLPSSLSGLCAYDDLVVSPSMQAAEQGNVAAQSTGAHIYARGTNGEYKEVAFIGDTLLVGGCTASSHFIVLSVFTQSSTYNMYVFVRNPDGEMQWKQGQELTLQFPATSGIISTSLASTDNLFVATQQMPNPINTGSVYTFFFNEATGQFTESTTIISGAIEIYSGAASFLKASVYGTKLAVTGLPGLASNATCATNVFTFDSASNGFVFESELPHTLLTPALGKGGLLASSTKTGVDLYTFDDKQRKFVLSDSFVSPPSAEENRGTKSLAFSADGSYLVRTLGPYNYASSTGCVVMKLQGNKVAAITTDTYGASPLTMTCVAGGQVWGRCVWDASQPDAKAVTLELLPFSDSKA